MSKQNHITITKELLHELFDYRDGELVCKIHRRKARAGHIAGTKREDGYKQVCINSKVHLLHRLIFMYHNGFMPEFIDHKDGDKTNNRIENLRQATKSENAFNVSISNNSKTGIKGVTWCKRSLRWRACIKVNTKQIHIGYFKDINDAAIAMINARNTYHGEFAKS